MEGRTGISEVICADMVETGWGPEVVSVLDVIIELRRSIHHASVRTPEPLDDVDRECGRCRLSPMAIFSTLEGCIGPDLDAMRDTMVPMLARLQDHARTERRCARCIERTREDLTLTGERLDHIDSLAGRNS